MELLIENLSSGLITNVLLVYLALRADNIRDHGERVVRILTK